ncbi:phosphatase domain protein [Natronomonas pharaonis DSM 2160]|uniref:Phosphatase domain protein n=1 Tax=Natronomonas pharaonis (strain ATCC 35678 / DSM 2160 / CIP 103997 / JCM 8858 / NBRC 14720 / NCIMB 2260 / Gabara) TaxID=348780 RepID=A0A1U7EVK0_NATPD|nr:metallophosphoesterase [Natronomonas pharaonis]CAI49050.1 phosphatase domain protein [Natronomonas pharaonis DSM 2160]
MPIECPYCSEYFDSKESFAVHLVEEHEWEQLSRIDKKRVRTFCPEKTPDRGPLSRLSLRIKNSSAGRRVSSTDVRNRITRRGLLRAGAVSTVGLGGIYGLNWYLQQEPTLLQENPDLIETRQRGIDGSIINGTAFNSIYDRQSVSMADVKYRFVVVSDSHWGHNYQGDYGPQGWVEAIERAKDEIEAVHDEREIDLLFHNGDIIHNDPEDHFTVIEEFFSELPDPIEWYPVMGNHDLLPGEEWEAVYDIPKDYTVELGEYVFIICDTAEPGDPGGRPGADVDFLRSQIDAFADKAGVFVLMHIPQTSAEGGSGDPDAVRAQLARDPVTATFFAHRHGKNEVQQLNSNNDRTVCYCPLIGDERPHVQRGFRVVDVIETTE